MSIEENKALTRRFVDQVLNAHNLAALDQFMANDIYDHDQYPGLPQGLEGQRQSLTMLFTALPDVHFTVDDMIAESDKVVTLSTMQGTQTGNFMGVPPSGKPVQVEGVDISRIENGKVVEHWGVTDGLGMMIQIGAMPMPGQPHT